MIFGRFGEQGELIFEIELVAANGEQIAVDVLLDTGFTTGFLAVHADERNGILTLEYAED